jgi:hypothetical protein
MYKYDWSMPPYDVPDLEPRPQQPSPEEELAYQRWMQQIPFFDQYQQPTVGNQLMPNTQTSWLDSFRNILNKISEFDPRKKVYEAIFNRPY